VKQRRGVAEKRRRGVWAGQTGHAEKNIWCGVVSFWLEVMEGFGLDISNFRFQIAEFRFHRVFSNFSFQF
jgi:hypothetical protein